MAKELKKILFVDDDPDLHFIVKMTLNAIPNVQILSALSGEEAVKIAMEFVPDFVLLDVMMPKMDGIATLQALKLLPSFASTPVVFLTAKAQKEEIQEYFKYGVLDVIIKPFDPITLPKRVLEIWERSQQHS